MDAKEALKHWAAWGRDLHKGATCFSAEREYAKDKERFGWPVDKEIQSRFRYQLKIAEKVEKTLISCLNKTELRVLVLTEVYGHTLSYYVIARRAGYTEKGLEKIRTLALIKFERCWHG